MPNKQFGPLGGFVGDPVTLMSGTVTTTSSTAARDVSEYHLARLTLTVTAASGTTPNMTVTVEASGDGVTWYSLGSFAAKTGAGTERKSFPGLDNYLRLTRTVTGTTPSFTATVDGTLL